MTNVKCTYLENKYLTHACNTNTYKTNIYHKRARGTLTLQITYLENEYITQTAIQALRKIIFTT